MAAIAKIPSPNLPALKELELALFLIEALRSLGRLHLEGESLAEEQR
jgi:hypothetical protein